MAESAYQCSSGLALGQHEALRAKGCVLPRTPRKARAGGALCVHTKMVTKNNDFSGLGTLHTCVFQEQKCLRVSPGPTAGGQTF